MFWTSSIVVYVILVFAMHSDCVKYGLFFVKMFIEELLTQKMPTKRVFISSLKSTVTPSFIVMIPVQSIDN